MTSAPRIQRSISYSPKHESIISAALRARPELRNNVSRLFQELLEHSLDPETGRAKNYLEARDAAIQFEADCVALLEEARLSFERNAAVSGTPHRVDLLVTKGSRKCIVELKSSGRRDRLELALGSALILARETALPLIVCVPYVLEPDLIGVFSGIHISLCTPTNLVSSILASLQK